LSWNKKNPVAHKVIGVFVFISTRRKLMKVTRYLVAVIVFVLLICSCASPLKKRLTTGEIPKYTGSLTPISIPVQLEYKPAKYRTNSSSFVSASITADEGSSNEKPESLEQESSTVFVTHLTKIGDLLTLIATFKEVTENYQTVKSDIPLFEVKLLIDRYGNLKESEISAPFFEQPHIKAKIEADKLEKTKEMMKKMFKYAPSLPQDPVVTGSILFKPKISELLSDLIPHMPLRDLIKEEPKSIVKGWGYFNGRKVMVSTMDYVYEFAKKDGNLRISMKGYSLWDFDNFMPVRSETFMNVEASSKSLHFVLKMIEEQSSSKLLN